MKLERWERLKNATWFRTEQDEVTKYVEELREILGQLLELDAKRPLDTTWWRRHWDAAKEKARALLGGTKS